MSEMSCSSTARMTSQRHPRFHGDGRQVRQGPGLKVGPRERLGLYEGEGPAPSLPIRHGDKEAPSKLQPSGGLHTAAFSKPVSRSIPSFLILALLLPQPRPSPICLPPSGSPQSAHPFRGPWEGHVSVSLLCCPFPLCFHFKMSRPLHQKQEGVQGSGVLGFKNQRGQGLALGCTARPKPPLFSLCSVCSLSFLLPPPSPHFLQPRLIHLQDLRAH